jgi:hypothetical protein
MIEKDLIVGIPPDLEAQILRYYHVEKWRGGTIARQLRVHHGTVARVLAQAGLPKIGAVKLPRGRKWPLSCHWVLPPFLRRLTQPLTWLAPRNYMRR